MADTADRGADASLARRVADVESRSAWLRGVASRRGARGVLLTSRASFAWATLGGLNHVVVGSEAGAVPLLVADDRAVALAPVNEAARVAEEEIAGLPIDVEQIPWEAAADVEAAAERVAGGRVIREGHLGDELTAYRSQLAVLEHERMRALAGDVSGVLDAVTTRVERGMTEHDAAAALASELLRRGIRAPVLLAAADARIERYRHPIPTAMRVERRLMLVAVGERHGLHSAATRIVELEPQTPDLDRRAAACRAVLDAMAAASRPGETLDDVLRAARHAYAETGFADEWRLHHQGGTIGYAPRERIATPGDVMQLVAGMAVAWNPSVTGTKLEATYLVGADGAEPLPA